MPLTAGIVGLPNVGKSTLFNAITKSQVEAANYPFATIQPNVGVVEVPDYRIDRLVEIFNPKKTIYTTGKSRLFEGLGDSFPAARYHSLAAVKEKLPDILKVTAEAKDGEIMAVEHTEYPVFGVQFHPESVMTPDVKIMVENFMKTAK